MTQSKEYYNYTIYLDGRIWKNKGKGKWMTPSMMNTGYYRVVFIIEGKKIRWLLHRLILYIFNPVPGCEDLLINHKDGNKTNNSIENLEWCTYKENANHAFKTGLNKAIKGEDSYNSKLTNEEVKIIKYSDLKPTELKKMYKCSDSTISQIRSNKNWKHI